MTYWALNAAFLVPAAAVLATAVRRRRMRGAALAATAAILLVLTAVFDNLMIAAGLFGYNPDRISGAFLGAAPLEDFAYSIAAVLLLPALWALIGGPRPARPARGRPAPGRPAESGPAPARTGDGRADRATTAERSEKP